MNHIEDRFSGHKRLEIYYQGWLPSEKPRAVLVVCHGLAEHSGRYLNLADHFVPEGYAVYGLDHRGHGRSEGIQGYTERFSDYVNDLHTFINIVRNKHRDAKIYLLGHSLGATIVTSYAVNHQDAVDGLICSAGLIIAGKSVPPALILLARLLSRFLPRLGLYTIDASALSRDEVVVNNYLVDPLVYQGKISVRLGVEILSAMKVLQQRIPEISLPVLIMHGSADRLTEPQGSKLLYERLGTKDKTYQQYDGFFHELLNEPGSERVFNDIKAWLLAHP